jgi:hypothetical protein
MSRIFNIASHARSNAPAYHRNHPALIDVLDHSDFTSQRPGTFVFDESRRSGRSIGLERDVRLT